MFDMKEYEFKLDGETYRFRPLNGDDLEDFYDVSMRLQEESSKSEDGNVNIKGKDMSILHRLLVKTIEKSYPDMYKRDPQAISDFVTQRLPELVEPLVNTNLKTENNASKSE